MSDVIKSVSSVQEDTGVSMLRDIILQCLSSANPKCRMLAVGYMRLLFGFSPFAIRCTLQLLDDSDRIVSAAAVEELSHLKRSLKRAPSDTETAVVDNSDVAIVVDDDRNGSVAGLQESTPNRSKQHELSASEWNSALVTILNELVGSRNLGTNAEDTRKYEVRLIQLIGCAKEALELLNEVSPLNGEVRLFVPFDESQMDSGSDPVRLHGERVISNRLHGLLTADCDFVSVVSSIGRIPTTGKNVLARILVVSTFVDALMHLL
jgi:hypothetical protein